MPILQTARELGLAIRSRRKDLGWDQATLAKQVGVTRQWVIEIEKGKPRAELSLALRALRVLGLSLIVEARQELTDPQKVPEDDRRSGIPDIDSIVERHRGSAPSQRAASGIGEATARLLDDATSISRLARTASPNLEKAAADFLRQVEAARAIAPLAQSSALARHAEDTASISGLARMATPSLPQIAADYLRKIDGLKALYSQTESAATKAPTSPVEGAAARNEPAATKPVQRKGRSSGPRSRKQ